MAMKFSKLTRSNMRKLNPGERLNEHGIIFERLTNGDGKFTINIMVDGQRIHRTVGKESDRATLSKTIEYIEKIKTEARENRLNLPKGRKLVLGFKEASVKYLKRLEEEGGKDIEKKRQRLNLHLVPFFGDRPLSQIETFNVNRYKKHRLESGAAVGTINRELAALSHLFSKAVEWRWLSHRPAKIYRFQEDNGRIVYLTTEQCARLLAATEEDSNPHIRLFILIALNTAMRRGEILRIQLKHIDIDRKIIYVPLAKAGAREQPMTRELAVHLQEHLASLPEEQKWLFPTTRSKVGHVTCIRKAFEKAVLAADLNPEQVTPHTLRHTAITQLVQSKVDLPTVQRISGHKTLQMVVRYSHQNGDHIQSAMDSLENRYQIK